MGYIINGSGQGGSSLPTATDAGQVPLSSGAGTTYTAADFGATMGAAMGGLVGSVAGKTIIGDGAGGVATTSADVSAMLAASDAASALGVLAPTAVPGSALHLHRLNEASGTLADQGSVGTAAVISGSSAVRATPGPYRWGGGIELVSPAAADRITVATSVPAGDCSLAVTIARVNGTAPSATKMVLALWDEGVFGAENTLSILLNAAGYIYSYTWTSGATNFGGAYTPSSWTAAHRCVVTYEHGAGATRTVRLYVDGVLRDTKVCSSALLATKTQVTALGIAGDIYSIGACDGLVISDTQVWGSLLTAAQVTADYRQVRGALL